MRFKFFAIAVAWLCLAGPAAAQPIDMAPICASYAGRTLYTRDSQPVSMTCEQLTAFSNQINMKEPVLRTAMPKLLPLGEINLDDFESGLSTGRLQCIRSTLASGRFGLSCKLTLADSPVVAEAAADDEGYITEIEYLVVDFRSAMKSLALRFAVPSADLTDDVYQLALDVAIAKDATFGLRDLVIERVGVGIRVKVLNIPRTTRPRIKQG